MATPRKATPRTSSPGVSLEFIYNELVAILKRHSPPFRTDIPLVVRNKQAFQLTVPRPVVVPGAYGGKPVNLQMAAVILQKGYVGFYMMCVYTNDAEKKRVSPALLKLLQGKSCFHIKMLDDVLRKEIEATLDLGAENYRKRGWL
jgi:hypothetical protein